MLTHVDVFLGVAMVMLAISLLLTIATQLISSLFNLRGRALLKGLGELFHTLKPSLPSDLARKILSSRLVADGLWFDRLAPAITKGDLLTLVDSAGARLKLGTSEQAELRTIRAEIETWFDAAMSRVANRFAMQARIVTVIGAAIAAFVLHLDSFGLVSQLYADSDLRAKMASAADGLAAQGEQILAAPSLLAEVGAAFAKEKNITPPKMPLQTRAQAEDWIRTQAPAADVPSLLAAFDLEVQNALAPAAKDLIGQAKNLQAKLASAGFKLIPDPYRPFRYDSIWASLGVLVSACLLSLGAPFWFNALKTASNLRPAIAAQVDSRESATQRANSESNA